MPPKSPPVMIAVGARLAAGQQEEKADDKKVASNRPTFAHRIEYELSRSDR